MKQPLTVLSINFLPVAVVSAKLNAPLLSVPDYYLRHYVFLTFNF